MTLSSLTIPENPAAWPAWLEDQLVSSQLGDIVSELQVLAGPTHDAPRLDTVIGTAWPSVFADGLSSLSPGQMRSSIRPGEKRFDFRRSVIVAARPQRRTGWSQASVGLSDWFGFRRTGADVGRDEPLFNTESVTKRNAHRVMQLEH